MKLSNYLSALACALLVVAGSGRAQAADTYDIDVVLPLTGGAAFLGKGEQTALQLLQKVENEKGGIHGRKINFVFHDDQTHPQVAVPMVNQIKAGNPVVVLGSAISSVCNAMAPLFKAKGPVNYCFSPSLYPKSGSYVFSSSISTKALAQGLLQYFSDKGWTKIGLLTSTDATGQDAHRNIQELMDSGKFGKLSIVADQQFNTKDMSASAQIQRIKGANPDVVIAWSTGGPIGTVFKAIKDAGLNVPIATTDGNMTYEQMKQYADFLPKDLYIPSPEWPESDLLKVADNVAAAKKAFFDAYAKANVKPDGPSTFAWDPALLVVEALKALPKNATTEDLRKHLAGLQGFAGINGIYDFKKFPQRGLGPANVVVTRWDVKADKWAVVSKAGGGAL
ncbi:MAG TPA: ABC transporter substrate-binding protein [Eoetvoesiella sp.]|uniref:ABC transporter substrate-binding protein n=1 Tax=Eoetvoesiella sp. TaxID=1966355 RepID=UPI002D16677B|nr:ABC transporter substrate-binding protein [Eoetvoesiella sp.]HWK63169.1 ABC transporter substrate-binding protein [Eoetvoesiella sp.]